MGFVLRLKYLVPSAISLLSLWYAIQAMMAGSLIAGCWDLLKCVVLDKLDGTAARTLKATSHFGMKLDSIVDAVAFGLVPGILIIQNRVHFGSEPWQFLACVCGAVYIVGTFYRLYKFDKLASNPNAPDCFIGIPSTLSAGIFASFGVAFGKGLGNHPEVGYLILALSIVLALLMNGNFPTLKVGKPQSRVKMISQVLFFLFVTVAIVFQKLPQVLFGISLAVLYVSIYYGGKKFGRNRSRSNRGKTLS